MITPLAARLKTARKMARLSQDDIAQEIGVSRSAVSQWEQGVTTPERKHVIAFAKHTTTLPHWLEFGDAAQQSSEPLGMKDTLTKIIQQLTAVRDAL